MFPNHLRPDRSQDHPLLPLILSIYAIINNTGGIIALSSNSH